MKPTLVFVLCAVFIAASHSCDHECKELFVRGIGDSNTQYLTKRPWVGGGINLVEEAQPLYCPEDQRAVCSEIGKRYIEMALPSFGPETTSAIWSLSSVSSDLVPKLSCIRMSVLMLS